MDDSETTISDSSSSGGDDSSGTDGSWYYSKGDGYMATSEYVDG